MAQRVVLETPVGDLRRLASTDGTLRVDGKVYEWELRCPGCGEWGLLDPDQLHGKVSVNHESQGCPGNYHERHDFFAHIPEGMR